MTLGLDEFLKLRSDYPVIDVRSESEFRQGHVRGAVNIPILNDHERKTVGTLYKQEGQKSAIKRGIELVGPRLNSILETAERVTKGSPALVHCWRGGMRSNNFCWLIERIGIKTFALQGGYKSYRQGALRQFEIPFRLISLTGSTGTGKTEILHALQRHGEQVIDLEGLANHKGSAFGGIGLGDQPTTEQFQNDLYEELLKFDPTRRIWVEDESIAVGRIFIPQPFWQTMRTVPVIKVDVDKAIRVERLVQDYGKADPQDLLKAMEKITRKLGGQHFNTAKEKLLTGDLAATAETLLTYYDKAYTHALEARKEKLAATLTFDWKNVDALASDLIATANELKL